MSRITLRQKRYPQEALQRKELDRFNDEGHGTWKRNRYLRTLATWNVRTMLTQERMERGSGKRSASARSEKMERAGDG